MKTTLNVQAAREDLDALGDANRSQLVSDALKEIESDPTAIGRHAAKLAAAPEPSASPTMVKTSLRLDMERINTADKIAKKLASNRNSIIQMIIKSIGLDIVH